MHYTSKLPDTSQPRPERDSVQRLVGPFAPSETGAWRRRAEILEALGDIRDLADEAYLCLDWRERITEEQTPEQQLRQAAEALREMMKSLAAIWPNSQDRPSGGA